MLKTKRSAEDKSTALTKGIGKGVWGTRSEKAFLLHLSNMDKLASLEKYRKAAELRYYWGPINRSEVLKFCDWLITKAKIGG